MALYKRYTVILLKPDHERDGAADEWTYIVHLLARSVLEAQDDAMEEAARTSGNHPDEYAVLVVYADHCMNIAM